MTSRRRRLADWVRGVIAYEFGGYLLVACGAVVVVGIILLIRALG
jgi:hypothetical protein